MCSAARVVGAWGRDYLELLKVSALPAELANARPKTLRFQLLTLPGRIVSHARAWILKLSSGFPLAGAFATARERLVQLAHLLHPAPA